MNGIEITPAEKENLFSRYCTSDGFVYYSMFLEDIDKRKDLLTFL